MDDTLGHFMSVTSKSSVAVIVPLYGYWSDIPDNPLVKEQVLSVVMKRIYSNTHHLYIIFVANPQTIPSEENNPHSVANVLISMAQAGNVKTIPVARDAKYSEYIEAGMDCALNDTNAQFVVVFNPWVMIQDGAIDVLIDRANRADQARVISGFDFRSLVEPENFDNAKINIPSEQWDISFNFMAMPRYIAEMITIDTNYETHEILERDVWQSISSKSFAVITTQRVPIFPFDFPWENYENVEQKEADKSYFGKKWGFIPEIISKV